MAVCVCGNEFDPNGKWGKRHYCSRSCANRRTHSEETKNKIRQSVKNNYLLGAVQKVHTSGWKLPPRTPEQRKAISERQRRYWETRKTSPLAKAARNKAKVYAYRARKYSAVPPDADHKLIRLIYERCQHGYEVDHIVALANGGLHHQSNLQYLPCLDNRKKGRHGKYDLSKAVRWQSIIHSSEYSDGGV